LAAEPGGGRESAYAALLNYSAHATVMGGGNTLISADWPGPCAIGIEQALGIETAGVLGAAGGRTPPRAGAAPRHTPPHRPAPPAGRVEERALAAVERAEQRSGTEIAGAWLFLREPYANPFFPLSFLGSAISRADSPPWLEGSTVGTLVGAARVGDLFFAALPGEGYPAIHFLVEQALPPGL